MAPIDPAQLLKALSPLLSADGGIKDATEVQRLSSLMKRFSRKLVSRCIYCCVLRATAPEILEIYLERDGWDTLLLWIGEAKDNPSFLKELVGLLDKLPMTVDRLKANNIAKIVKTLGKHEDPLLAQQAETLVSKWMKLIKSSPEEKEPKEKESKEKDKERDSRDNKDKDRDRRKDRKDRDKERSDKDKSRRHDDDKKKDDKDRHKSSSSSHKSSSRSDKDKDRDRDRDRKDRREKERDKSSRGDKDSSKDKDRSSSRREKESKGEKRKESDDREDKDQKKLKSTTENLDPASLDQVSSIDMEDLSDVVPPRPPTPPEIRKPKTERPKTVKEFGSKLRLASFLEDDNSPAVKKKPAKPAASASTVLSKPSTVPTVSRIRNLSGPSGVRASLMSAHMNQTEQTVGNIKLIAPKASHLIMENEGFMNALNASNHADKPGQIKKKKKIGSDKKAMDGVRRENSKDESGEEGQAADSDCGKEFQSVEEVKAELSSEVKTEGGEAEPMDGVKEESEADPVSAPPKLSFYKDTLEERTEDEKTPLRRSLRNRPRKTMAEQDSDDEESNAKDKLANEDVKVERMEDEASQESTSSSSQEASTSQSADSAGNSGNKVDEGAEPEEEGIPVILQTLPEPSNNTSGVKSILTIVTNKNKVKKSVRWKEESDLKTFYYFENDPNERINVNNANHMAMQQGPMGQMGMDIKMIEMRMERERLRAPNDRMEEQLAWRMPPLIDIPAERAPSLRPEDVGRGSEMRHIEAARQASVLEVIYFSRHMVPDSAVEPEPENRRPNDSVEVKVIPLEDVEAAAEENVWPEQPQQPPQPPPPPHQNPNPVPGELPAALTNLFANIGNPGGEAPPLTMPKMPPEIPIIPQGPPEHFPMGPAPPMGVPPPMSGHPDMPMPGHLGPPFMPPNGGPHGPLVPMVPIIPDQESGGHWGPMQSGPGPVPVPGPDMLHHQGPPGGPGPHHGSHDRGGGAGGNNERRQRGARGAGRPQIRGPPRTLCKFFKQGHCRFGGSCSFLHPGVNGPDIR